jgi:hypothetical protein
MMVERRRLVGAGFALASGLAVRTAAAATLERGVETWLRLVADPTGRTTFAVEQGMVWGFRPQADDLTIDAFAKRLYGYWSLVARKMARTDDGVSLTTRGWTFYLHPETGAIVEVVLNPYTGETVQCPPLSGPAFTAHYGTAGPATSPLDLRERRIGDHAFIDISRISRFKPKDTTWFKLEADLVSYACRSADLDRPGGGLISSTWSHNVVAEWQTWMRMHGTPGHILFKGDGVLMPSMSAAPPALIAAVEARFPGTLAEAEAWR